MVGVGLIGFISKLHQWDESAMYFDGGSLGWSHSFPGYACSNNSSLAAYMMGVVVYLAVTINSLRTIVNPIENVDTREDRIEAMRILSAGNVIIGACLGLILVLQVNGCFLTPSLPHAFPL
jgi:ER membrane protein SH3